MGEETRRGPVPGRTWALLIAVVLVASAIGIALGLTIDWFPIQGSTIASDIDTFWDVLLIASVPIAVGVCAAVVFSVLRWHVRPGEENLDGPPIHGNTRLEVIWTALPTALIAGLCAYATVLLLDIQESPAKGTRVVNVTGEQFAWSFETREGGKAIKSEQLYVPVGEPVQFKVRSKDVIHDFWVPEWRLKVDAVPGITTSYSLTPSKTGRFQVVCAELCGLGHAYMRQYVNVVSKARYAAWVRRGGAAAGAAPAAGGDAGAGGQTAAIDAKAVFTENCGSCHVLKAAGTTGQIGPDLDTLAKGDGVPQITEMIVKPNAEVPSGYQPDVMPQDFESRLGAKTVAALATYIDKNSAHGG